MINGAPANVKDYGAVGNGSTDDSASVTAARAVTPALYFSDGNFNLASQVSLGACSLYSNNSATIKGKGFKVGGVAPSGSYRINIEDFFFDGTGTTGASPNGALLLDNAHKAGVYNVRIQNYGITNGSPLVLNYSFLSSFYNCSVQTNYYGATIKNVSNNVAFYQCTFANNTAFGAYLRSSLKVVFNACDFEGNGGDGLTIDNINQATEGPIISTTVTDCYFEINGGPDIRIGTGGGGDTTRVKNTILKNNFHTGPGTYAAYIDYSDSAVIQDCYFVTSAYSVSNIYLSANSRNTTIIPYKASDVTFAAGATVSTRTIQTGQSSVLVNGSGVGSLTVTFAIPYETAPTVVATPNTTGTPGVNVGYVQIDTVTTTGFVLRIYGSTASITVGVAWRAGS
jgi:hypothetical protein